MATHPETMSLARRLADQIHGKIVELRSAIHLFHTSPAQCASPESFVGYFRDAACVVTISFHGTAFSIIFNRPFYTLRL
ncbi:MAG: polysaccharide pyruvyl transferase family protein, partial [Parabacteroides sp.]|nr:polysaccharide pyruvyl transferase family protein [Parabacteroides sp.]